MKMPVGCVERFIESEGDYRGSAILVEEAAIPQDRSQL
jgi:hypothetical protein